MAECGNQEFPTILGPDSSFKGEMSFEKGLRLMGKFEGKIKLAGKQKIDDALVDITLSGPFSGESTGKMKQ